MKSDINVLTKLTRIKLKAKISPMKLLKRKNRNLLQCLNNHKNQIKDLQQKNKTLQSKLNLYNIPAIEEDCKNQKTKAEFLRQQLLAYGQ